MAKIFYPDFFNDVFGPIMQPGSSTSFAGNSRIGRVASHTVRGGVKRVKIRFNPEDRGHIQRLGNMMEDRALLGGIQGFAADDERLFSAHELARKKNISYEFGIMDQGNEYLFSTQFDVENSAGETGRLIGASIGGGMIMIYEINGFPVVWQGDTHAILVEKTPSSIGAYDEFLKFIDIRNRDIPGGVFIQSSPAKTANGHEAWFVELSTFIPDEELEAFFVPGDFLVFPAILPVVTFNGRKSQLFRTVDEWIDLAEREGISFVQAAIEYEKAFSGWDDDRIWDYFKNIREILYNQIHALEDRGTFPVADTPLLPVYGKQWKRRRDTGKVLQDPLTSRILDYAFSTNAKIPGVKIVPGPMGTGGGYLFSALEGVREHRGFSVEKQLEGLVVAAALGAIAYSLCRASGASGCVGESGICCAMASGAITWMAGGSGEQVQNAASMALQSNIGIPCDPIPGGLEFPCLTRTVRAAVTAPLYADMSLAGIDPLIPYHEMLLVIEEIRLKHGEAVSGHGCGVNCTATAARCRQFLAAEVMEGKLKWEAVEDSSSPEGKLVPEGRNSL
ncbi:MAG: L-serine ammonia-lyase, iron-sulfur-dependent, subunit alpha [Treponema sp.]|jgi:L-serine dehydratase|nr:L-serine ammonia-lyase, iron-sulfur-dependent, subunit alpha [Treponema sp.]